MASQELEQTAGTGLDQTDGAVVELEEIVTGTRPKQANGAADCDQEMIAIADKIKKHPSGNTLWELLQFSKEEQAFDVIELLIRRDHFKFEDHKDRRDGTKGWTALHWAVERAFVTVCNVLIEAKHGLSGFEKDAEQVCPITMAAQRNDDAVAALLITNANKSKKSRVRELMLASDDIAPDGITRRKPPEIKFHDILQKKMPDTTKALLDCMMEHWRCRGKFRLIYKVLEADIDGRPPEVENGKIKWKESPLQIMVSEEQRAFLYHPMVRQLVKRKWNLYAKGPFIASFFLYLFSLVCLTFTVCADVSAEDVCVYDKPIDYGRAVTGIISYALAVLSLVVETVQVCIFRHKYPCKDKYNLVELPSAALLVLALPIRYTHVDEHWYCLSFGYLFWALRVLKYAAVHRKMAIYTGLFWQLMYDLLLPFSALFVALGIAFGGAIFVMLKADKDLHVRNDTSSFQMIMLTGLRTLAEGDPVLEDYVGHHGYRFMSCILVLLFLFLIIVVLSNILIAQMTDRLPGARKNVNKSVNFKHAQIIDSIDRFTFHEVNLFRKLSKCSEDIKYVECDVLDLKLTDQQQNCTSGIDNE